MSYRVRALGVGVDGENATAQEDAASNSYAEGELTFLALLVPFPARVGISKGCAHLTWELGFTWELVAIVATALIGFYGLRGSIYIRRREFEDIYVQRFWQINDRFPTDVRLRLMAADDHPLDIEDEETKRAVWDYLMLCEDEIDLRSHGQVTDETWEVWSSAITSSINRYPYKQMFEWIESKFDEQGIDADARPMTNLRSLYSGEIDTENYDPWDRSRLRNYVEGRREGLFRGRRH